MKKILLLLLLSIAFLGCKKEESAEASSSNDVKYEWTSETSSNFTDYWTENAITPITKEFSGKSWSTSFKANPGPMGLYFYIHALHLSDIPNTMIKGSIKGTIKILIGGKVVKSQDIALDDKTYSVGLQHFKAN